MKKRYNRIISAILILASLLSVFTVFVSAEQSSPSYVEDTGAGSVDLSNIELLYNRNFSEGWDYTNGFGKISTHNAYIDFEETATYKYNYFWRIEAANSIKAGGSSFAFGVNVARDKGTVVQFKIKADDACSVGRILYMTTAASKTIPLLYISGTSLYAFESGNPTYKIANLKNEWMTVTLVFDWDAERDIGDGVCDTCSRNMSVRLCSCIDEDKDTYCDVCNRNTKVDPCEECVSVVDQTVCGVCNRKLGTDACAECVDSDENNLCDTCNRNLDCDACSLCHSEDGDDYCDVCERDINVDPCEECVTNDGDTHCDVCHRELTEDLCSGCVVGENDNLCDVCNRDLAVNLCSCVDEDTDNVCDVCERDMTLDACKKCVDAFGKKDTLFKCRAYYGDDGAYVDYEKAYEQSKDKGMKTLVFGIGEASAGTDREGMSYCIDDLQIYQKTKIPVDLSGVTDPGVKVNNLAEIVIDVQEGPGTMSLEDIINGALCMKVGVDAALIKNQKQSIADYCAPTVVDGKVMVPLDLILDFINYPSYVHGESYDITTGTSATYITIGRDTATVDGVRVELSVAPGYITNENGKQVPVIAVEDIPNLFPGWLLTYDDMGLVLIYSGEGSENGEPLISRDTDLDLMLTIMKKFVFDTVTEDAEGNPFDEIELSYIATGEKVISDVKANSLAHPYIYTNQENFDALKNMYSATVDVDTVAQGRLQTLVSAADQIYSDYAALDPETGAFIGIKDGMKPVNIHADTADGYSIAGTFENIEEYSEMLVDLAFAYQITGENKYADLAYVIALALGEWTHWGPGNIINCAVATANFAVSYDWLYNYYVAAYGQQAVDNLASILYNKGVKQGYNSSIGNPCEFPKSSGEGSVYTTLTTNWNAACSSGMIVGALALVGYEEYSASTAFLIGNNIQNLIANGLDQYAPDGSYAESALMWADGTNGFVKLIMALESAAGTTYGFEDTWGLDRTFYFACYIEDSDGKIWNYHEGGADGLITGEILGIDTQMFNYAGKFLNDKTLIAIRNNQLNKGKEVTIFDMLFYPTENVDDSTELELDYRMEGIHAFVSRSDWEDGALYAGIMGGANDVYGGQIDSGNFIYRNKGVTWFMDLGSDNQEIYSYFGGYRYRHYRNNAEGQNVICVTSDSAQATMPYGQDKAGNGKIIRTYVNDHGSYAVLDNTSAFTSIVSYAHRGMLVTNDRKTVVIQDEISFKKFEEVMWIGHTAADIEIDKSGKVAYLTNYDENGKVYVLRASLVSRVDFRFETETTDTGRVLKNTYGNSDYKANGGVLPYSRSGIQRLVIRSGPVLTFNVAVVLELVDGVDSSMPLGYDWSLMASWEPIAEGANTGTGVVTRGNAVKSDIKKEVANLNMYVKNLGTAYTKDISAFYDSLTLITYTLKTFKPADLDSNLINSYDEYRDFLDSYITYSEAINSAVAVTNNFAMKISGIKTK